MNSLDNSMMIPRRVERYITETLSDRAIEFDWQEAVRGVPHHYSVKGVIRYFTPGEEIDWEATAALLTQVGAVDVDQDVPADHLLRLSDAIDKASPLLVLGLANDLLERDGPDWDCETTEVWDDDE